MSERVGSRIPFVGTGAPSVPGVGSAPDQETAARSELAICPDGPRSRLSPGFGRKRSQSARNRPHRFRHLRAERPQRLRRKAIEGLATARCCTRRIRECGDEEGSWIRIVREHVENPTALPFALQPTTLAIAPDDARQQPRPSKLLREASTCAVRSNLAPADIASDLRRDEAHVIALRLVLDLRVRNIALTDLDAERRTGRSLRVRRIGLDGDVMLARARARSSA